MHELQQEEVQPSYAVTGLGCRKVKWLRPALHLLNTTMKYVVHYIGEWHRNTDCGDPIFNPGWTKEYTNLDEMEIFYRHYFNQMLKENRVVEHSGVYVYQIQKG